MGSTTDELLSEMRAMFPGFVIAAETLGADAIEEALPGISENEIGKLEARIGLPLPTSYKAFLMKTRGFWLFGGAAQFGQQHPFIHSFPAFKDLSPQQRKVVMQKGR